MSYCVIWQNFTDISEESNTSFFRLEATLSKERTRSNQNVARISLEWIFKTSGWTFKLDVHSSEQDPVNIYIEHDNKVTDFLKEEKFFIVLLSAFRERCCRMKPFMEGDICSRLNSYARNYLKLLRQTTKMSIFFTTISVVIWTGFIPNNLCLL
jgi:hypothetical protein